MTRHSTSRKRILRSNGSGSLRINSCGSVLDKQFSLNLRKGSRRYQKAVIYWKEIYIGLQYICLRSGCAIHAIRICVALYAIYTCLRRYCRDMSRQPEVSLSVDRLGAFYFSIVNIQFIHLKSLYDYGPTGPRSSEIL